MPCWIPAVQGTLGTTVKKEERARWTGLAFVSGHFSQLDSLPSDSKIWSLSELSLDSACHPGFCAMASVRLGINNCERLSWKLSPRKTTRFIPFKFWKIKSGLAKKKKKKRQVIYSKW